MKKLSVSHVLFDIDDTLFPTSQFVRIARRNAIKAMIYAGIKEQEDILLNDLRTIIKQKGSNYEGHFNDLCKKYKKKPYEKYVAAGIYGYHITKAQIMPYPQVPRVLLKLRENGFKLYVATQGIALKQWDKLFRLHIANYFNDVFVSDKKDEKFYNKIIKKLSVPASQALMVGNNLKTDILPAKKVGINTLFLSNQQTKIKGIRIINSIDQIFKHIKLNR